VARPLLNVVMARMPTLTRVATSVGERALGSVSSLRAAAEVAAGMSILAFAFSTAQLLVFLEELWGRR
jgi:hypothetical protein